MKNTQEKENPEAQCVRAHSPLRLCLHLPGGCEGEAGCAFLQWGSMGTKGRDWKPDEMFLCRAFVLHPGPFPVSQALHIHGVPAPGSMFGTRAGHTEISKLSSGLQRGSPPGCSVHPNPHLGCFTPVTPPADSCPLSSYTSVILSFQTQTKLHHLKKAVTSGPQIAAVVFFFFSCSGFKKKLRVLS